MVFSLWRTKKGINEETDFFYWVTGPAAKRDWPFGKISLEVVNSNDLIMTAESSWCPRETCLPCKTQASALISPLGSKIWMKNLHIPTGIDHRRIGFSLSSIDTIGKHDWHTQRNLAVDLGLNSKLTTPVVLSDALRWLADSTVPDRKCIPCVCVWIYHASNQSVSHADSPRMKLPDTPLSSHTTHHDVF